MNHRKPPNIKR